jgi:hypothetical protein
MPLLSEVAGRLLRLPRPASRDVLLERDLPVTMDDGVVLLADRYAPPQTTRAPTVLVRSPYGRAGAFGFLFGRLLAERGLQVVVQSIRGTFGSGGDFDPFDERDDGLATLRWLREQPWHEGPVGTIGPSYMGIVQWAIADQVDAMAPSVTASQFRGMAYGGGAISLDTALSWMLFLQIQERRLAPLLLAHELRRTLPSVYDHVPLAEIDERAFGAPVPYFREWIQEMAPDSPYWSTRDYSANVAGVEAHVQLTGGLHDIFLPWLIEDFSALRRAGRNPQLIVGPWTHTSPALMGVSLREGTAWLRAHLLGDRRMLREAPVRVYVTGGPGWRELPDWPPPGVREHRLFLQPGGALADAAPRQSAEPSRFRYDPRDPTPALGGPFSPSRRLCPRALNKRMAAVHPVKVAKPVAIELPAIGPAKQVVKVCRSGQREPVYCDVKAPATASRPGTCRARSSRSSISPTAAACMWRSTSDPVPGWC